jgi:hypothetical protein
MERKGRFFCMKRLLGRKNEALSARKEYIGERMNPVQMSGGDESPPQ